MRIVEYKLSELLAKGDSRANEDDLFAYGEPKKLRVIAANPFLHGDDIAARAVVYADDGQPAAAEYRWPVDIEINGKVYRAESGGESFTREKYRKDSAGLDLWMRPLTPPNYLSAGCGMSQIAQKILRRLGRTMFDIPRRIGLFKSRSVVEMKLGKVSVLVTPFIDLALSTWWCLRNIACQSNLRGLRLVKILPTDCGRLQQIADIIGQDTHTCKEVHNLDWLKWHIGYASHSGAPAQLFAWEKAGKVVGFCMLKKKFYEQASKRGFRNVWLGSVIEWGVDEHSRDIAKWVVLKGALLLKMMGCDAAEVVVAEEDIATLIRKSMFIQVGTSNFGITVGRQSPLKKETGWDDLSNWRFRPAMCDNGIS